MKHLEHRLSLPKKQKQQQLRNSCSKIQTWYYTKKIKVHKSQQLNPHISESQTWTPKTLADAEVDDIPWVLINSEVLYLLWYSWRLHVTMQPSVSLHKLNPHHGNIAFKYFRHSSTQENSLQEVWFSTNLTPTPDFGDMWQKQDSFSLQILPPSPFDPSSTTGLLVGTWLDSRLKPVLTFHVDE